MNGLAGIFSEIGGENPEVKKEIFKKQFKSDKNYLKLVDFPEFNGTIGVNLSDNRRKRIPWDKIDSEAGDVTCLIFGESYGASIKVFMQEYLNTGISFLKRVKVDGIFVAIIFDKPSRQLHLISDPFGLLPLYYYERDGIFVFATEIFAILSSPNFIADVNMQTLYDFWTYGFALGDKTPFETIKVLNGGSILSYNFATKRLKISKYLFLENMFLYQGSDPSEFDLGAVDDAFYEGVQKRSTDADSARIGLSLSGGLDSRAILAGLGNKANKIRSYTLGLPGCADQRLASKMAELSGTTHDFIPINKDDLDDFEELARLLVFLSDGLYHPHESTERVALNYLATDPFDIMLRGHGGEIAKANLAYPFQAASSMRDCSSKDSLKALYSTASLGKRDIDWKSVFTDTVAEGITQYGPDSLNKAAQPAVSAGLSHADICVYLYISQWVPRQVVASLALFRSRVNVRLPYLDRNFLERLLNLPVRERWDGSFQRTFVKKFAPNLSRVPDSNTGAPLNAGAIRLWFTDKVNSILKRIGMPGYRHYTDFQSWQRNHFSNITEEILFDTRCLSRNYYNPKGLRKIFDLHVDNKKNYGHFLGTAVAIELWHRIFLDSNK